MNRGLATSARNERSRVSAGVIFLIPSPCLDSPQHLAR